MLVKGKILQIIPADGWYAVYDFTDPVYGFTRGEHRSKLVCWALVEGEYASNHIVGIDSDSDGVTASAEDSGNFRRYEYVGGESNDQEKSAGDDEEEVHQASCGDALAAGAGSA